MQPRDIIASKGIVRIAEAVGMEPNAVKQWKTRNSIPPAYWPAMSRAFPDLTIELLEASYRVTRSPRKAA